MFLARSKLRVEDVVAGGPADLDAVGGGDALLADGVGGELAQVIVAEGAERTPGDAIAAAGDATGEKRHDVPSQVFRSDRLLFGAPETVHNAD